MVLGLRNMHTNGRLHACFEMLSRLVVHSLSQWLGMLEELTVVRMQSRVGHAASVAGM